MAGDDAASGDAFQVLQALRAAEPVGKDDSQHQDLGRTARTQSERKRCLFFFFLLLLLVQGTVQVLFLQTPDDARARARVLR